MDFKLTGTLDVKKTSASLTLCPHFSILSYLYVRLAYHCLSNQERLIHLKIDQSFSQIPQYFNEGSKSIDSAHFLIIEYILSALLQTGTAVAENYVADGICRAPTSLRRRDRFWLRLLRRRGRSGETADQARAHLAVRLPGRQLHIRRRFPLQRMGEVAVPRFGLLLLHHADHYRFVSSFLLSMRDMMFFFSSFFL